MNTDIVSLQYDITNRDKSLHIFCPKMTCVCFVSGKNEFMYTETHVSARNKYTKENKIKIYKIIYI